MRVRQRAPARPLGRRALLQGTALGGIAALLAGCGGPSPSTRASNGPTADPTAAAPVSATPKVATGPLRFANWPAYIDITTLATFEQEFDVDVDYQEVIRDNATFMASIEPSLVANLPTGWDLIVLTDWMAARVVTSGWAERIDHANVPTALANIRDTVKGHSWDPNHDFHVPWQSGMTGIAYDVTALGRNGIDAPTSIADLWRLPPDKVTFLNDARDTLGLTLLKLGIPPDPATLTVDDVRRAVDDIAPLVADGLRFTRNEYLEGFLRKDTWAAMAWSGDVASASGADLRFVVPEEGVLTWTDDLLIPKGATNRYTAELLMDFVYEPAIAARITDYVRFISPVAGVEAELEGLDPDAADDPLLFPPPEVVARQHRFGVLAPELEATMHELFATLTAS